MMHEKACEPRQPGSRSKSDCKARCEASSRLYAHYQLDCRSGTAWRFSLLFQQSSAKDDNHNKSITNMMSSVTQNLTGVFGAGWLFSERLGGWWDAPDCCGAPHPGRIRPPVGCHDGQQDLMPLLWVTGVQITGSDHTACVPCDMP